MTNNHYSNSIVLFAKRFQDVNQITVCQWYFAKLFQQVKLGGAFSTNSKFGSTNEWIIIEISGTHGSQKLILPRDKKIRIKQQAGQNRSNNNSNKEIDDINSFASPSPTIPLNFATSVTTFHTNPSVFPSTFSSVGNQIKSSREMLLTPSTEVLFTFPSFNVIIIVEISDLKFYNLSASYVHKSVASVLMKCLTRLVDSIREQDCVSKVNIAVMGYFSESDSTLTIYRGVLTNNTSTEELCKTVLNSLTAAEQHIITERLRREINLDHPTRKSFPSFNSMIRSMLCTRNLLSSDICTKSVLITSGNLDIDVKHCLSILRHIFVSINVVVCLNEEMSSPLHNFKHIQREVQHVVCVNRGSLAVINAAPEHIMNRYIDDAVSYLVSRYFLTFSYMQVHRIHSLTSSLRGLYQVPKLHEFKFQVYAINSTVEHLMSSRLAEGFVITNIKQHEVTSFSNEQEHHSSHDSLTSMSNQHFASSPQPVTPSLLSVEGTNSSPNISRTVIHRDCNHGLQSTQKKIRLRLQKYLSGSTVLVYELTINLPSPSRSSTSASIVSLRQTGRNLSFSISSSPRFESSSSISLAAENSVLTENYPAQRHWLKTMIDIQIYVASPFHQSVSRFVSGAEGLWKDADFTAQTIYERDKRMENFLLQPGMPANDTISENFYTQMSTATSPGSVAKNLVKYLESAPEEILFLVKSDTCLKSFHLINSLNSKASPTASTNHTIIDSSNSKICQCIKTSIPLAEIGYLNGHNCAVVIVPVAHSQSQNSLVGGTVITTSPLSYHIFIVHLKERFDFFLICEIHALTLNPSDVQTDISLICTMMKAVESSLFDSDYNPIRLRLDLSASIIIPARPQRVCNKISDIDCFRRTEFHNILKHQCKCSILSLSASLLDALVSDLIRLKESTGWRLFNLQNRDFSRYISLLGINTHCPSDYRRESLMQMNIYVTRHYGNQQIIKCEYYWPAVTFCAPAPSDALNGYMQHLIEADQKLIGLYNTASYWCNSTISNSSEYSGKAPTVISSISLRLLETASTSKVVNLQGFLNSWEGNTNLISTLQNTCNRLFTNGVNVSVTDADTDINNQRKQQQIQFLPFESCLILVHIFLNEDIDCEPLSSTNLTAKIMCIEFPCNRFNIDMDILQQFGITISTTKHIKTEVQRKWISLFEARKSLETSPDKINPLLTTIIKTVYLHDYSIETYMQLRSNCQPVNIEELNSIFELCSHSSYAVDISSLIKRIAASSSHRGSVKLDNSATLYSTFVTTIGQLLSPGPEKLVFIGSQPFSRGDGSLIGSDLEKVHFAYFVLMYRTDEWQEKYTSKRLTCGPKELVQELINAAMSISNSSPSVEVQLQLDYMTPNISFDFMRDLSFVNKSSICELHPTCAHRRASMNNSSLTFESKLKKSMRQFVSTEYLTYYIQPTMTITVDILTMVVQELTEQDDVVKREFVMDFIAPLSVSKSRPQSRDSHSSLVVDPFIAESFEQELRQHQTGFLSKGGDIIFLRQWIHGNSIANCWILLSFSVPPVPDNPSTSTATGDDPRQNAQTGSVYVNTLKLTVALKTFDLLCLLPETQHYQGLECSTITGPELLTELMTVLEKAWFRTNQRILLKHMNDYRSAHPLLIQPSLSTKQLSGTGLSSSVPVPIDSISKPKNRGPVPKLFVQPSTSSNTQKLQPASKVSLPALVATSVPLVESTEAVDASKNQFIIRNAITPAERGKFSCEKKAEVTLQIYSGLTVPHDTILRTLESTALSQMVIEERLFISKDMNGNIFYMNFENAASTSSDSKDKFVRLSLYGLNQPDGKLLSFLAGLLHNRLIEFTVRSLSPGIAKSPTMPSNLLQFLKFASPSKRVHSIFSLPNYVRDPYLFCAISRQIMTQANVFTPVKLAAAQVPEKKLTNFNDDIAQYLHPATLGYNLFRKMRVDGYVENMDLQSLTPLVRKSHVGLNDDSKRVHPTLRPLLAEFQDSLREKFEYGINTIWQPNEFTFLFNNIPQLQSVGAAVRLAPSGQTLAPQPKSSISAQGLAVVQFYPYVKNLCDSDIAPTIYSSMEDFLQSADFSTPEILDHLHYLIPAGGQLSLVDDLNQLKISALTEATLGFQNISSVNPPIQDVNLTSSMSNHNKGLQVMLDTGNVDIHLVISPTIAMPTQPLVDLSSYCLEQALTCYVIERLLASNLAGKTTSTQYSNDANNESWIVAMLELFHSVFKKLKRPSASVPGMSALLTSYWDKTVIPCSLHQYNTSDIMGKLKNHIVHHYPELETKVATTRSRSETFDTSYLARTRCNTAETDSVGRSRSSTELPPIESENMANDKQFNNYGIDCILFTRGLTDDESVMANIAVLQDTLSSQSIGKTSSRILNRNFCINIQLSSFGLEIYTYNIAVSVIAKLKEFASLSITSYINEERNRMIDDLLSIQKGLCRSDASLSGFIMPPIESPRLKFTELSSCSELVQFAIKFLQILSYKHRKLASKSLMKKSTANIKERYDDMHSIIEKFPMTLWRRGFILTERTIKLPHISDLTTWFAEFVCRINQNFVDQADEVETFHLNPPPLRHHVAVIILPQLRTSWIPYAVLYLCTETRSIEYSYMLVHISELLAMSLVMYPEPLLLFTPTIENELLFQLQRPEYRYLKELLNNGVLSQRQSDNEIVYRNPGIEQQNKVICQEIIFDSLRTWVKSLHITPVATLNDSCVVDNSTCNNTIFDAPNLFRYWAAMLPSSIFSQEVALCVEYNNADGAFTPNTQDSDGFADSNDGDVDDDDGKGTSADNCDSTNIKHSSQIDSESTPTICINASALSHLLKIQVEAKNRYASVISTSCATQVLSEQNVVTLTSNKGECNVQSIIFSFSAIDTDVPIHMEQPPIEGLCMVYEVDNECNKNSDTKMVCIAFNCNNFLSAHLKSYTPTLNNQFTGGAEVSERGLFSTVLSTVPLIVSMSPTAHNRSLSPSQIIVNNLESTVESWYKSSSSSTTAAAGVKTASVASNNILGLKHHQLL